MNLKNPYRLALLAACMTLTLTARANGDLVITEIQAANIDQFIDPSWNYGAWMEIHNTTDHDIDITNGWVSDDRQDLTMARICTETVVPAGGYVTLWFDHHDEFCPSQIDMELDVEDGGTLLVSDSRGRLLAEAEYPAAVSRCSWARKAVDSDEWAWTSTPTPGASNDGATWCTGRLEAPTVDEDSQTYSDTLEVNVSIPEGATLRYTTDGSTPTATHGETSTDGHFSIHDGTVALRLCLVQEGLMPSQVVTRTYIHGLDSAAEGLPIVSVATDSLNLWGDDYGIFVQGNGNGRAANGDSNVCNWYMDWERPANVELITGDGVMALNQEATVERAGYATRKLKPYTFRVKAQKMYELQNYLPYRFFDNTPYVRHKAVLMRNGGSDNTCRIRDAALQEMVDRAGLDLDHQAYRPALHYINGRSAGTLNLREPNNKQYVLAHYGLDDDEIDFFEIGADSGYVQKCGTREAFEQWYELAERCADDATAMDEIRSLVDVDEFAMYMAVQLWTCNRDWPHNNLKAWRPSTDGGRFRFVLFDLDGGMMQNYPFTYLIRHETFTYADSITHEVEPVTIFLNMMEDDGFRRQFVDAYCLVGGSVYRPDSCRSAITQLAQTVAPAQALDSEVYGEGTSPWQTANELMALLSDEHRYTMTARLKTWGKAGVGSVQEQNVKLCSTHEGAQIRLNGLTVPTGTFDGQVFAPVTLEAVAPGGYRFRGWRRLARSTGSTMPFEKGAQWDQGTAPLGYGFDGLGTTLEGPLTTVTLTKTVTLAKDPGELDEFLLTYNADDGFVVSVNGTEAARYNMGTDSVTSGTQAERAAYYNPDNGTLPLPTELFHQGDNTLSVELHNYGTDDIYWDAALKWITSTSDSIIICTDEEYTLPTSGHLSLQAVYTALTDEEKRAAEQPTAPVVINEVSAANSVNVNEYYKKDDWVELYNTTDQDIDLEGAYMTDNAEEPQKWQITAHGTNASTVIKAHGYKIVWCSKRETDQELHASFKLENEDSAMVRIQAEDGSWADSLTYCLMGGRESVGRYPDAAATTYLMTTTTIGESNIVGSTATYLGGQAYDRITPIRTEQSSGPLAIYLDGDGLELKSEDSDSGTLTVCNTAGASVMRQRVRFDSQHAHVGLAALPRGVYVATLTTADGDSCSLKFAR